MEKGALIGKGMTSEVYEWGQDKVLKLYFDNFSKDDRIKYEADIGCKVYQAGIPSPAVFDIIALDGRKGLVFQRIFGNTILNQLSVEPWKLFYYSTKLANLHFRIHKCSQIVLPSQQKRFEFTINLSSKVLGNRQKKILDYLGSLPDGTSICHGDLHFNNVIVSNNKLFAIDWNGAYQGNPLGDVARTALIVISPSVPLGTPMIMGAISHPIKLITYWTYLGEYMRLANANLSDIDSWILPVAAAKIKDNVPGEQNWLMDIIDTRLKKL